MENPFDVHDLFALDRDVERAVLAWRKWRRALFTDPELHADEDVFILHRRVAVKSLFDALSTPVTAPPSDPRLSEPRRQEAGGSGAPAESGGPPESGAPPESLKESLRRWIAFLLQARLTRDADVAIAREVTSREPSIDEGRSYRDAWRAVVRETARGKSIDAFEGAASRGSAIAALHRERAARRHEILARLGWEGESLPPHLAEAPALARGILDATQDLADALLREEQKHEAIARLHPVDSIRMAMARGAREGWPARLSERWLRELFAGWIPGARVDLEGLPPALGGASFVRALEAFGQSFRTARFSKSALPFVQRHDPHFVDVHRVGALTASLVASPAFHRRALGLGKEAAASQARILGKTLLFSLRVRAARIILARADDSVWDEITARLLGVPAPRGLAGAWPEPHDDLAARLVGSSTSLALTRSLVDRFDEDWFFNPRAFEALRARTLYPARTPEGGLPLGGPSEDTLEPAGITSTKIGRAFEELVG